MKKVAALLWLSVVSALVDAACIEAEAPGLPHPDEAGEYEMLQAQFAVKEYLAQQELFLSCVQDGRRHNQAIDRMNDIADQYNRSARRYKARMESMDRMTELALLTADY
ncbi:hypothetical protein [Oceanicoccus sp. KOV_DT_Chl]|uniref:hypothetical protein n=1 Tax=Oceanicoccus sp. KOV_DT_Chl TaxID=1904639 RepID=UPI000C7A08C4|nr:hypothetical protein [Oceanicoccus sp. KOV_DT_Chl]